MTREDVKESKPDGVTEATIEILETIWRNRTPEAALAVLPTVIRTLKLASAVPAAPETIPGQWQPIETAPKDGTHVLLWCARAHAQIPEWVGPVVGYWADRYWTDPTKGGWVWLGHAGKLTHWMPLPAAPAVSQPPADTRETGNG